MGRVVRGARFQLRVAILAALVVGILVPAAPAQTPVTITVQMNLAGTVFLRECDCARSHRSRPGGPPVRRRISELHARCLGCCHARPQPALLAGGPTAARTDPGSSKPTDDSGKSSGDSGKSSSKSPGRPARAAREQSRPPESASLASRLALAELAASPPPVQERASPPPPQGAAYAD